MSEAPAQWSLPLPPKTPTGAQPPALKGEIKDGVLTVSGERKYENESKGEGYHRVERSFGRFSRSLRLPRGVDASAVSASFDRGVLEVTVPKPTEPAATKVAIGAGKAEQAARVEAHEDPSVEAPAEAGAAA